MISNDPTRTLLRGVELLKPLLEAAGFAFSLKSEGASSGGHFAVGEFRRDDLSLELHFRSSLGLVTYSENEHRASHSAYMKQLGAHSPAYPGFSEDPLDGFRHLLEDLDTYGSDFLCGRTEALKIAASLEESASRSEAAEKTAGYVGDRRHIETAKAAFKARNYSEAAAFYRQLEYPELLSAVEEKMFAIAKKRSDAA